MPRASHTRRLIEFGYVQDGETVLYVDRDTREQLFSGQIVKEGILIAGQSEPVSLTKFAAMAGRSDVKAPTLNIILPSGVSMADALCDIMGQNSENGKVKGRTATSEPAASRPSTTRRGDDDNDDWCGVCLEKGDLLMCDGCCLSFHWGCIGYQDLDFLSEDDDWLCWNCSKRLGKEFAVDTRPVDPRTVPNIAYVAVDERLEYYYKFDVLHKKGKRGRRLVMTLRTGPDAERDIVEMTFDSEDRRIWRGDISRKTKTGWVVPVEPAPNADLSRYPVPLVPRFHCVMEQGHPPAPIPPPPQIPPPPYSARHLRNLMGMDDRNTEDMIAVADILSQFASFGDRNEGQGGVRPGPSTSAQKRRAIAKKVPPGGSGSKENEPGPTTNPTATPGLPRQVKMTETALKLDVNDDVEVWINETNVGPGGWVPGRVAERAVIDEDGSGAPYFAFYLVEMLPFLEQPIDLSSKHPVMKPLMQVRRPLAVPVGGEVRYASMVRKPLTAEERRPARHFRKGDRVEAIVCGRFAPGTISRDTGARSSTCRVRFDNPAKEMGYKAAMATQSIDAVRLTSLPARYYGMLR